MERIENLANQLAPVRLAGAPTNSTAFAHLTLAPPDPILGTALAYKADTNKDKMNLGIENLIFTNLFFASFFPTVCFFSNSKKLIKKKESELTATTMRNLMYLKLLERLSNK